MKGACVIMYNRLASGRGGYLTWEVHARKWSDGHVRVRMSGGSIPSPPTIASMKV